MCVMYSIWCTMYIDRCIILMVFAACYVPMVDNLSIYRRVFIRKSLHARAFVIWIPVTRAVMNPKLHNNGHRIDEISFILCYIISSRYLVANDISHTKIQLTYSHNPNNKTILYLFYDLYI